MSDNIFIFVSVIVAGISLILSVYTAISTSKFRFLRKFFANSNEKPENLEDIIQQIVDKIYQLDKSSLQTAKILEGITQQLNTATQNVGIVRYNGNGDDGGNLSFSTALLDAHQSGILITSLHGRQQSRIYAKVVTEGVSESTLSDEEKEALVQAITNGVTKPNKS